MTRDRRDRARGGASSVVTRLSVLDHELCSLLSVHRVLTTTQLVSLSRRPERTIDYRLQRLREEKLVERARPYVASGSAPFSWWLTRTGAHLTDGTSPAPGKATPNPLFLRHTTAIAGLYVALLDVEPSVGLTGERWVRAELAWEEWLGSFGAKRHLRPDAYVEIGLSVDDAPGTAGAFVEIDFATMDQARLRAKVARHRDYAADRASWVKHPGCPVLLLLTTSEQRVTRFLSTAERDKPKPSIYEYEDATHPDGLVAACASVGAPDEALFAPVWRTSPGDAPMALASILADEVRTFRRVVRSWHQQRDEADRRERAQAIERIARDRGALGAALGAEGEIALNFLFEHQLHQAYDQERWALEHLDFVETTLAWWEQPERRSATPPDVAAAWRSFHFGLWREQAEAVLADERAIARSDPRLRRIAADLVRGELVEPWRIPVCEPVDGHQLTEQLAAEYVTRRHSEVDTAWHATPLHRRLVTSVGQLEAEYDATHFVVCVCCGIARHVPEVDQWGRGSPTVCPTCGGALVPARSDPPLPPPLAQSLAVIERRLARSAGSSASW